MDKKIFFSLVIVCITTHLFRLIYEILKHKKAIKVSKISFVVMFINMLLLWISWFLLCSYDIFHFESGCILQYTAISIVVAGIIIFIIALFTIKSLESYEGELICKGIYSKIRHPMYLGFILWLIGPPLFFGAFFSFILSFLLIANVLCWRYLEEKELENRYPTYKDYRKSTIF